MKKTLGIIIILVVVVVGGFWAIKHFGKELTSPTGGKSLMDLTEEQGGKKMSEEDWIKGCEESDPETRGTCFSMGAVYYRNPRFCDHISKPADRATCKKGIEEAYKELDNIKKLPPEEQAIKMQEWIQKQSMMEAWLGKEKNYDESAKETGPEKVIEETKPEKPIIKSTGKMNEDIFVEIYARSLYLSQLMAMDPMAAEKIGKRVTDPYAEFGVTEEEFEAYSNKLNKEVETNSTKAMQLMRRVQQRAAELQKTGL